MEEIPIYSVSSDILSFVNTLSFNSTPLILDRKIYHDNLHIEHHPYDSDADFACIRTPYNADAFKLYLSKANILDRYPELPFKLQYGFSLGPIPSILTSYTPDDPPYLLQYSKIIREYIDGELILGRFSGPFTKEQLESKIGPFRSSPIQVAAQVDELNSTTKYRCCRNLSFKGSMDCSVNDLIDSNNFHTRWYTAAHCAEIVRISFLILAYDSINIRHRNHICPLLFFLRLAAEGT